MKTIKGDLVLTKNTVFDDDLTVEGNIICRGGCWNLHCLNLYCRNLNCRGNLYCQNLHCWNLNCQNLHCRNLNCIFAVCEGFKVAGTVRAKSVITNRSSFEYREFSKAEIKKLKGKK